MGENGFAVNRARQYFYDLLLTRKLESSLIQTGALPGMSFFDLPPVIERMLMVSDKISDLNFSVGQLPQVEINGKLTPVQPLGLQKLTPYQTEIIAMTLLQENSEAADQPDRAKARPWRRSSTSSTNRNTIT